MSRLFGILVTHRRPAALDAALAALSDPRHGLTRLVVVDNAAAEETPAILDRHPGLATTLLASPENLGPAGGIALGMQAVAAEADDDDWVVLLDDDNVNPGELALADLHAVAVAARSVDPAVAMVGAVGGRLDRRRGRIVRVPDEALAAELVPVDFVAGGQFPVISMAAIRRVGPFRADLFFGFDDLEFGLRLTKAGYRVLAHGPTWLARRRRFGRIGANVPPVERDPAPWRRYYAVRNLLLVLRSHQLRRAALVVTLTTLAGRPLADWHRRRPHRPVLARLTLLGLLDGWLGRTGRRVEPTPTPEQPSHPVGTRTDPRGRPRRQGTPPTHRLGPRSNAQGDRASGSHGVKVVYVAGYGRSGSTVLDLLLGQHPGWISCGELRHLPLAIRDGYRCACGKPVTACPRWAGVIDKLGGDPGALVAAFTARRDLLRVRNVFGLLWPRLLPVPHRDRLAALADAAGSLYGAIAAVTGATVVVDSSKDPLWGLLLARTPGIDLRVVQLVRDPRAVAHSWQRRRTRPELAGRDATMPVHSPIHSALEWDLRNVLAWMLGRVAGGFVRIRYEDLVADPLGVLRAVSAAAGEPLACRTTDLSAIDAANHTVAGNPVRFAAGRLVLRADEEWRSTMARRDRLVVGALTLPLLIAYGYGR